MKQTTPSLGFPSPTKFSPISTSGRDFLGQQSIIQHMADVCLPSFTNSTSHIRYFTFWAWAFKMAKKNLAENELPEGLWKYLARLEVFFIWANKTYFPEITGLPGSDKAGIDFLTITGNKKSDILDFKRMKISAPVSFSSPYYKPSIGKFNVVVIENGIIKTNPIGKELADEFDNLICNCSAYSELVSPRNKQVNLYSLTEMREKIFIKKLTFKEREILTRMIIQDETKNETGVINTNRVHSILLILDIINKYKVNHKKDIHEILLDTNYFPPDNLQNILGGYKIIELRRYYQLSLESILYSFLAYISSFGYSGGSFNGFCNDITEFIDSRLHESGVAQITGTLNNFNIIFKLLSIHNDNYTNLANFAMSLKEKHQKERLQYNPVTVLDAILLILRVSIQASEVNTGSSKLADQFLKYKLYSRHSMNEVISTIHECKELSLRQGIEKLIIHLSLKMHLSVANHKFLSTGNYTYKFSRGDGLRFVKIENMNLPNSTANKLFSFFDNLEDLDLIGRNRDGHFVVKDRGRMFIADYG